MSLLQGLMLLAVALVPGHAQARSGGGGSAMVFFLLLAAALLPLALCAVPAALLTAASIASILLGAGLLIADESWRYQPLLAYGALVFGVGLAAARFLFCRNPAAPSPAEGRPPKR